MQKHGSKEKRNAIINGSIKMELLRQNYIKKNYKGKELKELLKKSNVQIQKLKKELL